MYYLYLEEVLEVLCLPHPAGRVRRVVVGRGVPGGAGGAGEVGRLPHERRALVLVLALLLDAPALVTLRHLLDGAAPGLRSEPSNLDYRRETR